MDTIQPAPQITIRDLDVLRVATQPLRQQILATLNGAPRAVREVANELGLDPHCLYYHVHLLEEKGLLRAVDSRVVSGIIEKRYQVTAHEFLVDTELVSPGGAGTDPVLDAVLNFTVRRTETQVRDMVRRGVVDLTRRAPEPTALLSRANFAHLSEARARELSGRILELLADFSRDVPGEEPERGYWISVTFHACDLNADPDLSEGSPL